MNTIARLILTAAVLMGLTLQQCNGAQTEHRLALLVQVSEFKTPGQILPIKGVGETQVDAQMIGKVLTDSYQFVPTILEQRNATHDAIIAAMDKLAADASPGDAVLFYFSGHGASNNNQFSLCPWDVLLNSTTNDVTETDVQHWLDKLNQKQINNVTIILDSCFSMPGVRFVMRGREKLMRRSIPELDTKIPVHLNPNEAVVLSATGKNGTAYEGTPDPQYPTHLFGIYTQFLCKELTDARPGITTFRQVSDVVKGNVTGFVTQMHKKDISSWPDAQTPGIYGSPALVDRPLFAAVGKIDVPPPPAPVADFVKVVAVAGDSVTIDRGKDTGVQVGDTYDLYPSDETQFSDPARKVGSFKVADLQPNRAVGAVLEGAKQGAIAMDDRAKLAVRPVNLAKTAEIVVKLDGSDDFNKSLAQELKRFPFIKTTGQPQLVIKGTQNGGMLQATVFGADGTSPYETKSINGGSNVYSGAGAAELCTAMSPLLAQMITMDAIMILKNPSPAFTIEVSTSHQVYRIQKDHGDFSVKCGQDGYLFIFDIDSAGTPSLLFPYTQQEANSVKGNELVQFPQSIDVTYDFYPPAGTDTLIAVLITDKSVAESVRTHLFGLPAARIQPATRLTLVTQDLAKIDLGPTNIWNVGQSSFTTTDMPVVGQ